MNHVSGLFAPGLDEQGAADWVIKHLERQAPWVLTDTRPARQPPAQTGVYALYYVGYGHPHYGGLNAWTPPVYVGKASSSALGVRLKQHRESISATANLRACDFAARWLACGDICCWFEQVLIRELQPLWNVVLTGFGNKAQGQARRGRMRSMWDTAHPGRADAGTQALTVVRDTSDKRLNELLDSEAGLETVTQGSQDQRGKRRTACLLRDVWVPVRAHLKRQGVPLPIHVETRRKTNGVIL